MNVEVACDDHWFIADNGGFKEERKFVDEGGDSHRMFLEYGGR